MEEGKTGWICPICKNGVAPAEKLCPHCIPDFTIKSPYPGLKEETEIGDPYTLIPRTLSIPCHGSGYWARDNNEWFYVEGTC